MDDYNYLGKGWSFPPEFGPNGKNVKMVEEEADVKQALNILFTTALQERLNRPDFGCDLNRFMFEEIDAGLALDVQEMILNAIDEYEPRIELLRIEVTESEDRSRLLLIEIDYQIKETNSIQNLVYPFYLYK